MADQENKPLFKAAPQCTVHDFMAVMGPLVADCMVASEAYRVVHEKSVAPFVYLLSRVQMWAKEYEQETVAFMLNNTPVRTEVLLRNGRYNSVFHLATTAKLLNQVVLARLEQELGDVNLFEREEVLWTFSRMLRSWPREKDPTVALAKLRQRYAEYVNQIENRHTFLLGNCERLEAATHTLIERLRPHLVVQYKNDVMYLTDPKGN